MMRVFAGYDGGGTKTACILCDETGTILGRGVGGPSNYLYCGKETAARSMRDATEAAFRDAGIPLCRLDTAYMASAAIPTFGGESHVPFFKSCIDTERMIVEGDIYPIRYAAVRDRPAAVSIVGTGSITYVFHEAGFTRVGGWGPTLGDEGSGYDIGRTAMRKTLRMCDGREAKDDRFVQAVLDTMQVAEARKMVAVIREGDERSKVASVTKTVCGLYETGNETAKELLQTAADEICLAVRTACERSGAGEGLPLILSGSLVREGRPLFRLVSEKTASMPWIGEVYSAKTEPEIASLALALRSAGLNEASERVLCG